MPCVVVAPDFGEQGGQVLGRVSDGGQLGGDVDKPLLAQPAAVGGEAFVDAVGLEQQARVCW